MSDRATVRAALLAFLLLLAIPPAAAVGQQVPPKLPGQAQPNAEEEGREEAVPEPTRRPEQARGSAKLAEMTSSKRLQGKAEPDAKEEGREEAVPEPTRRPEQARGKNKLAEMTSSKGLPGKAEPDAEAEGRSEGVPEPPAGRQSSAQRLLEKVDKGKVDEARQRARGRSGGGGMVLLPRERARGLSGGGGMALLPGLEALLPSLGALPGGGGEMTPPAPSQAVSITLPWTDRYQSPSLWATEACRLDYGDAPYRPYCYSSWSYSVTGASAQNGTVIVRINVAADGWYIINLYSYVISNAVIDVRHGSNWNQIIETFPAPGSSGWLDMPVLLELSAGYHYFRYTISGGSYFQPHTVEFFSTTI